MKELTAFLNKNVGLLTRGAANVEGSKFGVELELEGRGVAMHDVATRGWNRKEEASLRGESIEYVTTGPKSLDEAKKITVELFERFAKNNVRLKDSVRTSTHVHLNFADKKVKDVVNFFSLFTLLEEVLQYYSGLDRKGLHFCLSTRESEGIVGVLAACIRAKDLSAFAGDRFKYGACNLSSLYKFGTIEVRTMRGASSAAQVTNWLDILSDVYEYSLRMKSPVQLVTDLSHLGAKELLQKIFKERNYQELLRSFPAIATLHYSLLEGARTIQVFAYEFEEALTAPYEEPPVVKLVKIGKKVKLENLPADLPYRGPRGRYMIYMPDGNKWHCYGERENGRFWEHGERLDDFRNCRWDAIAHRFTVYYDDGRIYRCNWANHDILGDEGPGPHGEVPWAREFEDADEEGEDF